MKTKRQTCISNLLIALFIIGMTFVEKPVLGATDEIRVNSVESAIDDGWLSVSAQFKNLFSDKTISTIQSGLPSFVHIEYRLIDFDDEQVFEGVRAYSISYDVWDERYTIQTEDTTLVLFDFESVEDFGRDFKHRTRIDHISLDQRSEYAVQIRIQIIPISAEQGDRVSEWLENPNDTGRLVASDTRSNKVSLNLNKVVSFLVGRTKQSRNMSEWAASKPFRIVD